MKILTLLTLGLLSCITAKAEVKKEVVIEAPPKATYIAHFGCISKDTINDEVSQALGANCAQYNAEVYIFQDELRGVPCEDNGLQVTVTYKCVLSEKDSKGL